MKILIDSVYIHNGGGKEILDLIINYICENNLGKTFFFLIDKRYNLPANSLKKIQYSVIQSGENNRKKFYKNNSFECYFSLNNVPPPINVKKKSIIYFHNDLFLSPSKSKLGFVAILKNIFKKYYIVSKIKSNQEWCVQTKLMKKKLNQNFYIPENKIHVHPIFDPSKIKSEKTDSSFLYVCNSSKHKNHKILMDAFIKAAKKIKDKIHLKLTLSKDDFIKSEYDREKIPSNLFIENMGVLNKESLSNLYLESRFLIFPSLNESLGLPLIEAVNRGCYLIVSDKEYVKEVVNPSIIFNPYSSDSISEAIINSLSKRKLKKSELIIENKIDTFVKHLLEHV
tara:strand:- start:1320 stop:2339 length:1020 start_codon:yes stop_codon:yes gene_type:complete